MPASTTDYSKIKDYREAAASKIQTGRGVDASAGTLGDSIMKAVRADRSSRGVSKLATDVGNVMGQMVTDPAGIRERTSGMVDPMSVNALTSKARAQNLRTLGTAATHEAAVSGTIQESIQAGANQLKARAQELYAQAEQDTAQATAMESEWERGLDEEKFGLDREKFAADEAYRQSQLNLAREKFEYDKTTKGVEEDLTADQQKRVDAVRVIKGKAEFVLQVIQNKDTYTNQEAYMDALRYAVSDYNKRGFEEGGQALTPSEQAVIAGTQIRTTPGRQANFFEKFAGITPKSASAISITDDEASIINKMEMAIIGVGNLDMGAALPESWKPD